MGFIRSKSPVESESGPFYDIIHLLVIVLSDLSAGTMQFQDVLGISRKPVFEEFQLFLQTMEVYGSGYDADVDYSKYNMRACESHS